MHVLHIFVRGRTEIQFNNIVAYIWIISRAGGKIDKISLVALIFSFFTVSYRNQYRASGIRNTVHKATQPLALTVHEWLVSMSSACTSVASPLTAIHRRLLLLRIILFIEIPQLNWAHHATHISFLCSRLGYYFGLIWKSVGSCNVEEEGKTATTIEYLNLTRHTFFLLLLRFGFGLVGLRSKRANRFEWPYRAMPERQCTWLIALSLSHVRTSLVHNMHIW